MSGEIKRVVSATLASMNSNETLTDRDLQVIGMSYFGVDGECLTLEDVGKKLGITRERVRQIESKALAKMRHPQVRSALKDLVGN